MAPQPRDLPSGSVTFLFTDIEGSTARLQELGEAGYAAALGAHRRDMRAAFAAHGGIEVDTQGDAFLAAFRTAADAVLAAVDAQLAHRGTPLIARMGIHTGRPIRTDEGYVGLDLHRGARVAASAHGGQVVLSGAAAQAARGELPDTITIRELGRYRLKDMAGAQAVYQAEAEGLVATFPRLRTLEARSNNLPVQLTSLIGREEELGVTLALLESHRLVTLMATGGTGKTRLALQAGAELIDRYGDGVWFVDLAAIRDPDLVASEVATVLGVAEEPTRPLLETLGDAARSRSLLLILDNCEQVVEACAKLAHALLAGAPGVRVLATSRMLLGVPGEATYRLQPLGAPDPDAMPEAILRFPAVQLLLERAQVAKLDLVVTAPGLAAAAEICRRLDGIPLAIELAAARARAMSLEEIATRLEDRFRLLTSGARSLLPRQQTLRALIDWSYDLLDDAERLLFARLAVFEGSWDAELAEAVCADAALPASDVLDVLLRLVDRSLVSPVAGANDGDDDRGTRYRMLDTLRAYAGLRLAESGPEEASSWRRRHLEAFAELSDRWTEEISETGIVPAGTAEMDDLRAATAFGLETDPTQALRIGGAMAQALAVGGKFNEARGILEAALSATADSAIEVPAAWRLRALWSLTHVLWRLADYEPARTVGADALETARAIGERSIEGMVLGLLGLVAWEQGDLDEAEAVIQASLEVRREIGHEWGELSSEHTLGLILLSKGAWIDAIERFEEIIDRERATGRGLDIGVMLNNIAVAAERLGDIPRARAAIEEGVRVARQRGDRGILAFALLTFAHVDLAAHDLAAMRAHVREGVEIMAELAGARGIAYALEHAAVLAGAEGSPDQALRLTAAAAAIRDRIHAPLQPEEVDEAEALVTRARGTLEPAAADAAWAAGSRLSPEAAVAAALEGLA
jgi:predicted ATPase